MDAATLMYPRLPLIYPKSSVVNSTSRLDMPPCIINCPASINKGMAISSHEFNPKNIRWGIIISGISLPKTNATNVPVPIAKAIGIPIRKNNKMLINSSATISIYHRYIHSAAAFILFNSAIEQVFTTLIMTIKDSKNICIPAIGKAK